MLTANANTETWRTGGKVFCALLIQVAIQADLRNIGNPAPAFIPPTVGHDYKTMEVTFLVCRVRHESTQKYGPKISLELTKVLMT